MRDLWHLRGYLRPYWKAVVIALLVMGASGLLMPEAMSKVEEMFDSILPAVTDATDAGLPPGIEALGEVAPTEADAARPDPAQAARTLLLFLLAAALADGLSIYMGEYVGQHLLMEIRRALFSHLQKLSMSFYDSQRIGELLSRINTDSMVLQRALAANVGWAIVCPIAIAYGIVLMAELSWRLTLVMAFLLPIVAVITWLVGTRIRMLSRRMQEKTADLTTVLHEGLTGARVIKIFGIQPQVTERFDEENQAVLHTEMKAALARGLNSPVVMATIGLSFVGMLYYGGREIDAGHISAGDLMAFLFLLQLVATQVSRLSRVNLNLARAGAAASRHRELLEIEEKLPAPDKPVALPVAKGHITFENVSFAYSGRDAAINELTLDIAPGEMVALAGPSGAGTTTVANLVPRLYDATEGRVLIDGIDVREVDKDQLRSHISIVPQDTLLFATTVRENIGYGRRGASEEEIIAAARTAHAHDFIMKLPQGYDTQVGDRGTQLSGGQRQRVAIARAVLRDPAILIMDEATSSLDSESEAAIQTAMQEVLKDRTSIIIAHRLSTIRDADRIITLDEGRVAEIGTHDELLARGGLYARLHAMQQDMGQETVPPTANRDI